MKNFLNLFVIVILFWVFSGELGAKENSLVPGPLIGFWASLQKSKGGFTNLIEFKENGVMTHLLIVMDEYTYEIKDNILTLKPVGVDKKTVLEKYTVQLLGEKCSLKSESGTAINLVKQDDGKPTTESNIIGKWSFKHQSGATGFYVFKPSGRLLLRIPMPGATISQYRIEKNQINITRDDISSSALNYTIEKNGFLIISTESDQKKWKYKKIRSTTEKEK